MKKLTRSIPNFPIKILGLSTALLLKGLIQEIDSEKWESLTRDPTELDEIPPKDQLARRAILQQSLFRMMQHMSNALNHTDDFNKFTEAIELLHCEMATLLYFTSPFRPRDFRNIYLQELQIIPEELRNHVTVGLNKTAMNTFAGICRSVLDSNPEAQMVYGNDSYFENTYLLGKQKSITNILNSPDIKSVDLYAGEFNHNINIYKGYHHYLPGDIIGDVEKLLTEKPSQHLTVAIDSTIDFVNSENVQTLLEHFSKQILEGKLNLIVYRSGQKFDMLGMDNYYGTPYYMVNNGGQQWDAFKKLNKHEAFQTDPLSIQWFCLVNKYASQQLENYRGAIFKNSRKILNRVPAILRDTASPIRVSTVDPKMDLAFIDIKTGGKTSLYRGRIEKILYEKMVSKGRKVTTRGSFGFYHPNFNFIDDNTLRINPGLDPKDNEVIVEVLEEIAIQVRDEMGKSG